MNEKEPINLQLETEVVDVLDHCCGTLDISRSAGIRSAIKEWCSRQLAQKEGYWDRAAYGVRNRAKTKSPV